MKSFLCLYIGASLTALVTTTTNCNVLDAIQQVPNAEDGANATLTRLEDLNGYRHVEFFLVGGVPADDQIKGTCYNTSHQNTCRVRDSCPQTQVDKVNPTELAKEYGVTRV